MSKKALTLDLETGKKKLTTIIDDSVANAEDEITFSGKYINDNLISKSHESNVIGEKILDESNINDSYVLKYDKENDKIEYTKVEDVIEEIDCGYF